MPSLPYREARHFLFAMDYTSKRWKHLRARVLREQPLCQEALRYGRREPATVAHHVYPVEDFPGWRFCRWNLIAVSADAHNSFHDRATGKRSRLAAAGIPPSKRAAAVLTRAPEWGTLSDGGKTAGGGSDETARRAHARKSRIARRGRKRRGRAKTQTI